jgi:GNAT superfamily N-acetyltransferase
MPIEIRLEAEADHTAVAALLSLGYPEPVDVDQVRTWRQTADPARIRRHMVAAEGDGAPLGYAHALRDPWDVAGVFWLHVAVDPTAWHRGIGDRLFAHVQAYAREHGAALLHGEVREAVPEGMMFAERHGFAVERHIFDSTLDLASFDEARFGRHVEAVEAARVRFFTLADLGNAPEAQHRLHALNEILAADVPGHEGRPRPFGAFARNILQAAWYRADGQIVAALGDEWIGLTGLGYFAQSNHTGNMMTGVLPAYRGRGIALALKLLAIRTARRWGAAFIHTNNDSENAPMLAVNRKLGYLPKPGYYRVTRDLSR